MQWDIDSALPQTQPQCSTGQGEFTEVYIKYNSDTIAISQDNEWTQMNKQLELEELVTELNSLWAQPLGKSKTQNTVQTDQREAHGDQFTDNDNSVSSENGGDVLGRKDTDSQQAYRLDASKPRAATLVESLSVTEEVNFDQLFVHFEKLRMQCMLNENKGRKLTLQVILNIADIGGQPAFLEMLPSLTIVPALYLVFMKLDQDLRKCYSVPYKCQTEREVKVCQHYTYTTEEVIFTALSSIACFGHSDKDVEQYVHKNSCINSRALIMGTFADLLENNDHLQKQVEETEDQLRQCLERTDFYVQDLLEYSDSGRVLFKVNNKSGGQNEVLQYRELLEELIRKKFQKFNIPARWLMFSVCLKLLATKLGQHTVSYSNCLKIGNHFGMSEEIVVVALKFLHRYVGILMFYPDNEDLKKIVICDPQVVFSSISELIFNVYSSNKREISPFKCDQFKNNGLFTPDDIKSDRKDLLSNQYLVQLMVHLNIAAQIPESSDYFLPAVLASADSEQLEYRKTSKHLPEPLCIFFPTGYLPLGLTCALITKLISMPKFELMRTENLGTVYKNKVTFRVDGKYNVQLISWPKFCEVRVTRAVGAPTVEGFHSENCCPFIRSAIVGAINHVIVNMEQSSIFHFSPSYKLAFRCPVTSSHRSEESLGHEPLAALDSVLNRNPKEITCVFCKTTSSLTPEMNIWFGKVIT